jgi:hypothetical protein
MPAPSAALLAAALASVGLAAAAPAPPKETTYISGSWYAGLASCGGKPYAPFNFTANACSPLNADGQLYFKGYSVLMKQPKASAAVAELVVFSDDQCTVQPTSWGSVADGGCQMSYWSTKYTFDTIFNVTHA